MNDKTVTDPQEQARILSEALPHMQRYDEETIVIKYGGHAMGDEALARSFANDIVLLEQTAINPVVVHGGGPQIEAMLKRAGVQSQFAGGLAHHRRRDAGNRRDGAGRLDQQADRRLHQRRRRQGHRPVRQGRQHGDRQEGDAPRGRSRTPTSRRWSISASSASPTRSILTVLNTVLGRDLIPVLAPVCAAADGGSFNVNADTFAGAIAGALKAKRFLLLTDVPGVLDKSKELIKEMSAADVRKLIADGTISGGMIPKVETCLYALEKGVEGVVILDGKVPHAVLLELFTDHGAGTLIHR